MQKIKTNCKVYLQESTLKNKLSEEYHPYSHENNRCGFVQKAYVCSKKGHCMREHYICAKLTLHLCKRRDVCVQQKGNIV